MHKQNTNKLLLIAIFFIVMIILWFTLGTQFFSARNITSMGFQIAEFAFLALAMSLAMLSGGIDLSVVANMNLSGILAGMLLRNLTLLELLGNTGTIVLAISVGLISATILGLFNGALIAFAGVPAILATIGTMLFYSGIAMAITKGQGVVGFPIEFTKLGSAQFLGFPFPMMLLLLAFLVSILALKHTIWGKSLYLIGESRVAALFSGLKNEHTYLITYAIGGLFCGFSGLVLMARANSIRVGYGNSYLLQAILVSILGGINPSGGKGKLSGVLVGILILQSLSSAFTIFRITPYARGLIYGTMLIGVMILESSTLLERRGFLRPRSNKIIL